jgi:hypothetical protein
MLLNKRDKTKNKKIWRDINLAKKKRKINQKKMKQIKKIQTKQHTKKYGTDKFGIKSTQELNCLEKSI